MFIRTLLLVLLIPQVVFFLFESETEQSAIAVTSLEATEHERQASLFQFKQSKRIRKWFNKRFSDHKKTEEPASKDSKDINSSQANNSNKGSQDTSSSQNNSSATNFQENRPEDIQPSVCHDYNCFYNKFKNKHSSFKSSLALSRALKFYIKHKSGRIKCHRRSKASKITNHNYILITDYTIPHPKERFFILNLKSGEVIKSPAAHGIGSNEECPKEHQITCKCPEGEEAECPSPSQKTVTASNKSPAQRTITVLKCKIPATISNTPNSNMTSKGFFITEEPYQSSKESFKSGSPVSQGNNGIRLKGLQYGINHKARVRGVVYHRASYYNNPCSNSEGCPAINPSVFEKYKESVHGGALFYIHTKEDKDKTEVPDCVKKDLLS